MQRLAKGFHVVQIIKPVSTAVHQTLGIAVLDLVGVPCANVIDGQHVAIDADAPLGTKQFMRAKFQHFPIGQDNLERLNMPTGRSHHGPMASRGIERNHSADGRDLLRRRIGTKITPVRLQHAVEIVEHHARFDPHALFTHLQDFPHKTREVDHQPTSQRTTGKPRATATGMQGDLARGGVFHRGHNIVNASRPDHAQRRNLVDARVAGKKLHEQVVAVNFAHDLPPQIIFDALLFCIHKSSRPIFRTIACPPPRARRLAAARSIADAVRAFPNRTDRGNPSPRRPDIALGNGSTSVHLPRTYRATHRSRPWQTKFQTSTTNGRDTRQSNCQ